MRNMLVLIIRWVMHLYKNLHNPYKTSNWLRSKYDDFIHYSRFCADIMAYIKCTNSLVQQAEVGFVIRDVPCCALAYIKILCFLPQTTGVVPASRTNNTNHISHSTYITIAPYWRINTSVSTDSRETHTQTVTPNQFQHKIIILNMVTHGM